MGVSRSPVGLAEKLGKAAALYSKLDRVSVEAAAQTTKKTVQMIAPARLRNVGKNGSKLDVGINIGNYDDGAQALVFAKGPWAIIEGNTKDHLIVPAGAKGLGRGRKSRHQNAGDLLGAGPTLRNLNIGFGAGAVLKIGDGFAAYARHPGTRGQHPWARGTTAAQPLIRDVFQHAGSLPLLAVF